VVVVCVGRTVEMSGTSSEPAVPLHTPSRIDRSKLGEMERRKIFVREHFPNIVSFVFEYGHVAHPALQVLLRK